MAKVLKEDVCLNSTKTEVVDCNSEEAAYFYGGKGTVVSDADIERLGLETEEQELAEGTKVAHTMHLPPVETDKEADERLFADQTEAGKEARRLAQSMPGHEKQQVSGARPSAEELEKAEETRRRQAEATERKK